MCVKSETEVEKNWEHPLMYNKGEGYKGGLFLMGNTFAGQIDKQV